MATIDAIDITSLNFQEGSAPGTPSSTQWKQYTKTDGLYVIDDAGTETGPLIDETAHDLLDHTGLTGVGGSGSGISSGTAMPGGPSDGDLFYRTDLDLLCRYRSTGTRWVSTTLYNDPVGAGFTDVQPFTATKAGNRVSIPHAGSLSLWIEEFWATFYVSSGTALSASHKWVCTLISDPSASTVATINIDSGSSAVWRNSGAVSVAAVSATTEFVWTVSSTKTGTPGNLYFLPRVRYRLILT